MVSTARRMGYFALTMAGTWMPTITAKTHSSRISQGTSEPPPPAVRVGMRKYAANNSVIDASTRSRTNPPSLQASRFEMGIAGIAGPRDVMGRT